ncbi:MAG: ribonuclease HII [Thermoanaerobaculia bacterium]|nr:ribonuclease HII [Thermoanaerobaculia bacterium]
MAEAFRLHLMRGLEEELRLSHFSRIAGVDEVGRGCLAGPVVAAAVIVDPDRLVPGVEDSKKIGADERERIAAAVRSASLACEVAAVSADAIDRTNILRATREAMTTALRSLRPAPDCAIVDAVRLDGLAFPTLPVVRGDALSYAVACASIVAKVERDRMMRSWDRAYPQYGFARHKGYAAREHRLALAAYGPTPIHRLSFRSVVPRVGEPAGGEAA